MIRSSIAPKTRAPVIVVDTNVIAYFFMAGERTESVRRCSTGTRTGSPRFLWKSEFRSVLGLYVQRILVVGDAVALAGHVESFMKGGEYAVATEAYWASCREAGARPHDCEFVALAVGMDVPQKPPIKIIRAFPGSRFRRKLLRLNGSRIRLVLQSCVSGLTAIRARADIGKGRGGAGVGYVDRGAVSAIPLARFKVIKS